MWFRNILFPLTSGLLIVAGFTVLWHFSDSIDTLRSKSQQDERFTVYKTDEMKADMNSDDAEQLFFNFISRIHYKCNESKRFGRTTDGGWDICLEQKYRPSSPCLVYSFGINKDFSFDDAVSTYLNCTVKSFDPSMKTRTHQRSERVWFYKIGLSGKDMINNRRWTMKTLQSMMDYLNDTNKVLDYLKMDIEYSEWSSFEDILKCGILSKVKQLGIEIHPYGQDISSIKYYYDLLVELEKQGMRRWYFLLNRYKLKKTKNGLRSCCYEMVYVNSKFYP